MCSQTQTRHQAMFDKIVNEIHGAGGTPYLVGGAVRDEMMGGTPKDKDIEIYGLPQETVEKVLSNFGKVDTVGKTFGVTKLKLPNGEDYDFSLPRRDSKIGVGHKGFNVEVDHTLSPKEALARRDFTVNSMMRNLVTGELVDPYGGEKDLKTKTLRATSQESFSDDPLRVLRGMQFAARFGFDLDPKTAEQARNNRSSYSELTLPRVWGEWEKLMDKGKYPSKAMDYLQSTGWDKLYPQLHNLQGVQQDPYWHPEGDVWTHTAHVMDAASKIAQRENLGPEERRTLMMAALTHDLGKPKYTRQVEGRWRAHGHESGGVPFANDFMSSIGTPKRLNERVLPLVANHMFHANKEVGNRAIARLVDRLHPASFHDLRRVVEADYSGRPPLPARLPDNFQALQDKYDQIKLPTSGGKFVSSVNGADVMRETGMPPGKEIGELLNKIRDMELEGKLSSKDAALDYLRKEIQKGMYKSAIELRIRDLGL